MLEIADIAILPPWPLFLGFALAGLALNLVPGADMAYVVTAAARHGRRAGITAALGIGAGSLVHILAAALGLSTLLAASQAAFNLLKWIGAAYLLYLAVAILRSPSGEPGQAATLGHGDRTVTLATIFRRAALVNVLNPKVALFFLAFLPQFIDPHAQIPAVQIVALGLWFDAVGTLVNIAVAVSAASAASRLRGNPRIARAARYVAAAALGALAIRLATAPRHS